MTKQDEYLATYRKKHHAILNKKSKAYHWENRRARILWAREYRRKNKMIVVAHYSNGTCGCSHCGFADIRTLQIDHVDGGGEKHRHSMTQDFYVWLIKNNFPDGFQVLCSNCQWIKMSVRREYSNKWEGK